MSILIFILLGIAVKVVNINGWFIIPDYVSWICFGIAGLNFVFSIIQYLAVKQEIKNIHDKFHKF